MKMSWEINWGVKKPRQQNRRPGKNFMGGIRMSIAERNQVHRSAEFSIEQGKLDEYKKLIREISRAVESSEPDTIGYQFFLNETETKCIVHETYRNSSAVLAHNNSATSKTILPEIFRISSINRLEVYGNPDKELQIMLK